MMRRLTSGPKPAVRVARIISDRGGRVDPQAVADAVEAGEVGRRLGRGDQVVGGQPVDRGGHRHLVDLGPGRLEGGGRLPDPGGDVGAGAHVAVEHLPHQADPQALDPPAQLRAASARAASGDRGGVEGVGPGDHVVEQRGVGHGGGERPDLVERRGEGDQPVAGHPPVGGLHADDAAQRGGLADRAAGVGAQRQGGEAGRHRGGAAARGAARDPAGVVGVAGRPERRVLGASCPWRTRRGSSCR